jgi:hypothetical protein
LNAGDDEQGSSKVIRILNKYINVFDERAWDL